MDSPLVNLRKKPIKILLGGLHKILAALLMTVTKALEISQVP
jgi:hypothetical protein